jgi:hypothetical protein
MREESLNAATTAIPNPSAQMIEQVGIGRAQSWLHWDAWSTVPAT